LYVCLHVRTVCNCMHSCTHICTRVSNNLLITTSINVATTQPPPPPPSPFCVDVIRSIVCITRSVSVPIEWQACIDASLQCFAVCCSVLQCVAVHGVSRCVSSGAQALTQVSCFLLWNEPLSFCLSLSFAYWPPLSPLSVTFPTKCLTSITCMT